MQSYTKSLKNNKDTGTTRMKNKLFQEFKKPLSEPLTLLINLASAEGKFLAILKMVK